MNSYKKIYYSNDLLLRARVKVFDVGTVKGTFGV